MGDWDRGTEGKQALKTEKGNGTTGRGASEEKRKI